MNNKKYLNIRDQFMRSFTDIDIGNIWSRKDLITFIETHKSTILSEWWNVVDHNNWIDALNDDLAEFDNYLQKTKIIDVPSTCVETRTFINVDPQSWLSLKKDVTCLMSSMIPVQTHMS